MKNRVKPRRPNRWLNRTVAGAGLTSALGDFCYETTTVVLPGFLSVLGLPAAALGLVEGLADAVASTTKMLSGFLADRLGHRKGLVLIGYALTPVGQLFLAAATGLPLILFGRIVSWFGKGLRGPLRDAIVVQAVSPETRGRAFGFHRAMDSVGAVVGPLLGVVLLGWAQTRTFPDLAGPFRFVLYVAAIPGMLAVLSFLLLVQDPGHSPNPTLRLSQALHALPRSFLRYLRAVGLFGLGDFSHSLLILAATQLLTPERGVAQAAQLAGLLYVVRNVVQVVASYPIGALADRWGHRPVLTAGYGLGAGCAALTAVAFAADVHKPLLVAVIFMLAGLYVATQEALESTVTAQLAPREHLTTSYGALGTVNGLTKLVSSTLVGGLWTLVSPVVAFAVAALLMTAGTFALRRGDLAR